MDMNDKQFFTIRFGPDDGLALVLISAGSTIQRIMRVREAISEKTLSWLRYENLQGYNIYSSASRLAVGARTRMKDDFHHLQKTLWIELDFAPLSGMKEWENKLPELPLPNIIVSSSPGKFHIYWVLLSYIHSSLVEALNKAIAGYFRAKYPDKVIDSVHDISRVLRMPGFKNWKNGYYTRLHWVRKSLTTIEALCDALRMVKPSAWCDFSLSTIEQDDAGYNHTEGRLTPTESNTPHKSQSEADISRVIYLLANGLATSDECIEHLREVRVGEKKNLDYYARLTVTKAKGYLEKKGLSYR